MNLKKFSLPTRTYKVKDYELWFMKTVRKLNSFTTLQAGLFVCFVYVPFVFSVTDIESGPLNYGVIYNTRNDQIQDRRAEKPYNASHRHYQSFYSAEDTKENDVEEYRFKDKYEISDKEQLLVGFARDPFRLSIPEADYLNGVREVDPKQYSSGERGKRGVAHLYNMLLCATGCEPLSYQGYGCYCGFLGSGRPMDGIDYCCKLHDECYDSVSCPFYSVYFQPYYWTCYQGEPVCSPKNYRFRNAFINGCAARLCECDRRLAKCVQRYSCPNRRRRPLCKSSPIQLLQNLLVLD